MVKEELIKICFTFSFDNTLFIEHDLLGLRKEIVVKSEKAFLEFPREPLKDQIALQHTYSSPSSISHLLPEKHWGLKEEKHKESMIECCSIIFEIQGIIDFDLSKEQIGGDDIRNLSESARDWFYSFNHWIWLLSSQIMNPIYPDPRVLHRKSNNIIVTAFSSDKTSVPTVFSGGRAIGINDKVQASEQIVNRRLLDLAICSVDKTPPIILELLASARMAARRGDFRRSIVDAGTASELALSDLIELDSSQKLTLGGLISEVQKRDIPIPSDTKISLVDERNAAIHRGYIPSLDKVIRALEIAEYFVKMNIEDIIPLSELRPIYRPQRFDLVIIKNTQKK